MTDRIARFIDYYRRCYLADSRDLTLWNINKVRKDRRLFISGCDDLGSGALHRIPIVGEQAESLYLQSDAYRKERTLIYGSFFICGNLRIESSFSESRTLCAPVIYYPAKIYHDEDYFVEINLEDLRINYPLLRQLLSSEYDNSVIETFPQLHQEINISHITKISAWLEKYTEVKEIEELGRWPALINSNKVNKFTKRSTLSIHSASVLALVDRSRGSRGTAHELKLLSDVSDYSAPIKNLFDNSGSISSKVIETDSKTLPCFLSKPQTQALKNTHSFSLSLVSGPPGTGKSYSIAAMAVDAITRGESVLVVAKTEQAVDVIAKKLRDDFELASGFIHGGKQGFHKNIKAYLDTILNEGVETKDAKSYQLRREIVAVREQLSKAENRFNKRMRLAERIGSRAERIVLGEARLTDRFIRSFIPYLLDKTNPPWSYLQRIRKLIMRAEKLSSLFVDAIYAERLAQVLKEQRSALVSFNKAIRARSSKRQSEYFQSLCDETLLQAFPMWLVCIDEIHKVLPLKKDMFDLVIFDEATQCDVANALPILQRGKRAVIVGDAKQLRHVSFLSRQQEKQLMDSAGINKTDLSTYSYRDRSLLDLVSDSIDSQSAVTMLDEHFRSKPELIEFSNQAYYSGRLKVMRSRPGVVMKNALQFEKVEGMRNKKGINLEEAQRVFLLIDEHLTRYQKMKNKPSLGVLSPYRDQSEYILKESLSRYSAETFEELNLRIATPFGFQGEERDVMILSMAIDDHSPQAAAYLNRLDMFNVAITRARESMIVLHSVEPNKMAYTNQFRRYFEAQHLKKNDEQIDKHTCEFIDGLSKYIKSLGFDVWSNFSIGGTTVNIVCNVNGVWVGFDLVGRPSIEADGFNLETYKTLLRTGLSVLPISYGLWSFRRAQCFELIDQQLGIKSLS